jgi:hypothetical protein
MPPPDQRKPSPQQQRSGGTTMLRFNVAAPPPPPPPPRMIEVADQCVPAAAPTLNNSNPTAPRKTMFKMNASVPAVSTAPCPPPAAPPQLSAAAPATAALSLSGASRQVIGFKSIAPAPQQLQPAVPPPMPSSNAPIPARSQHYLTVNDSAPPQSVPLLPEPPRAHDIQYPSHRHRNVPVYTVPDATQAPGDSGSASPSSVAYLGQRPQTVFDESVKIDSRPSSKSAPPRPMNEEIDDLLKFMDETDDTPLRRLSDMATSSGSGRSGGGGPQKRPRSEEDWVNNPPPRGSIASSAAAFASGGGSGDLILGYSAATHERSDHHMNSSSTALHGMAELPDQRSTSRSSSSDANTFFSIDSPQSSRQRPSSTNSVDHSDNALLPAASSPSPRVGLRHASDSMSAQPQLQLHGKQPPHITAHPVIINLDESSATTNNSGRTSDVFVDDERNEQEMRRRMTSRV